MADAQCEEQGQGVYAAHSWGVIRSFAGHRWQQGGNTPPCTSRKENRGEAGEIGLFWAVGAMDRNQT